MAVSKNLMAFRRERASDLERAAQALDEVLGNSIIGMGTSQIYDAASKLRDPNFIPPMKDGSTDGDCWGYSILDFTINIPKPRHVKPSDVDTISVITSVDLIAKCADWEGMCDPLTELSFRVALKGLNKKTTFYSGFHVDKHDMSKTTDEPHPIYHIQYVSNPREIVDFQYGNLLNMDTPRIPHYPLDFILGMGFVTSNFFPDAFELLMDNGLFVNLSKRYQQNIWKPYAHTLANHWKPFMGETIVWTPTTHLFPTIL